MNKIDKSGDDSNSILIDKITYHMSKILELLDVPKDNHYKDTPKRVAKMYVNDFFVSLNKPVPHFTTFKSDKDNEQILVMSNIPVLSMCKHHLLPFWGSVKIGYIPNSKIIGLSKIPRLVNFLSQKPQVQEELTNEIHHELVAVLNTDDVIVIMECEHSCMSIRGPKTHKAKTKTIKCSGKFTHSEEHVMQWKTLCEEKNREG
jgi:GTP cyclohydrolase IA